MRNNLTTQSNAPVPFAKPVLIGAGIALLIISFLVFGVDEPNPEWGRLWRIQPLIITPLAGAMGGAFFYFMNFMGDRGVNKTVALLLGLLGFVVALWMGTVLGLVGTMWN
jgi:hypothetical protein